MRHCVAAVTHMVQVLQQYLAVHCRPILCRLKKINGIHVCDVNSPSVWLRVLSAIFLHVHAEKAHIDAVQFLERKQ